jgi:heptosyltransferase-2
MSVTIDNQNIVRKLVIAPAWVGDMVMAQSLFMLMKEREADIAIDIVAPPATANLAQRMPQVDQIYTLAIGHGQLLLGDRYRLGKSLRDRNYHQAYILPNSFKSALVPWIARIPVRTGWRGEFRHGLLNDLRQLDKQRLPLMVERFCALVETSRMMNGTDTPRPRLEVNEENRRQLVEAHQLRSTGQILGLCPGAEFGPAKQWPASAFSKVAENYIEKGGQVWIFGSHRDVGIGDKIVDLLPSAISDQCVNLAGQTSLLDVIDLLSVTEQVVTNDSGLMHVAAAVDRPLVVVYGSTSPGFTPPLSKKAQIATLGLECSPCFKRECPLGHTDCLQKLTAASVITLLDKR